MSAYALRGLERSARARNRREGVTGLAVYEDGRFFQWLEGPTEALDRVWSSIRHDRRHTDIADFTVCSTPARMFDGWDMRLAVRGEQPPPEPPASLLSLVSTLVPVDVPVIPFLPVLVEALVLPQIFAKRGTMRRFLPPVSPVAVRLSKLLLEEDDMRLAAKILRRRYAAAGSLGPLCATLIEPAARMIGDLWLADDCTQLDMTRALGRLQTILRQLPPAARRSTVGPPVVLVAPQPGELHSLCAALDAELLWQAGWDTHIEFPATDDDLRALVSQTWFDVLDLTLSPSLQRSDSLVLMADTISAARAVSVNPALAVVVGGRAFHELCEGAVSVGADASTTSALHVVLAATAARTATLTKLAQSTALVTSS